MAVTTGARAAEQAALAKVKLDAFSANIRILESFYSFLIGLAVTQATITLVGALVKNNSAGVNLGRVVLYCSLLITIIPFYQGMNRYLYDIHVVEPFENKNRRLPPLLLDIYAFVVLSCLLFAMGRFIDDPLAFFYLWSAVLAVDVAWTLAVWWIRKSRNPLWAWNNLAWLIIAWISYLAVHRLAPESMAQPRTSVWAYLFVGFEVLRTIADYRINWKFYFPTKPIAAGEAAAQPIIYLAGPYSNDGPVHPEKDASSAKRVARFNAVTEAARMLIEQGHIVYSPLTMTHPIDLRMQHNPGSAFWVGFDEAFMAHCSRVIVLCLPGWEHSSGIAREIASFDKRGISYERREPAEFGIGPGLVDFAAAFD